jgi:hypothetical protein
VRPRLQLGASARPLNFTVRGHMSARAFGITKYVLAFALLYLLFMAVGGILVAAVRGGGSGLNILVLLVAATCVALWFIRRNRRQFTRTEYVKVLLGSFAVDAALQLTALQVHHLPANNLSGMVIVLGGHALLLALAYSPWSWFVRSYAKRVCGP